MLGLEHVLPDESPHPIGTDESLRASAPVHDSDGAPRDREDYQEESIPCDSQARDEGAVAHSDYQECDSQESARQPDGGVRQRVALPDYRRRGAEQRGGASAERRKPLLLRWLWHDGVWTADFLLSMAEFRIPLVR